MIGIGLLWLSLRTVEASCEHGNESSDSIEYREFL
jgi:hypothetical protein